MQANRKTALIIMGAKSGTMEIILDFLNGAVNTNDRKSIKKESDNSKNDLLVHLMLTKNFNRIQVGFGPGYHVYIVCK